MPQTLFILDGHSHLYASYFAIRSMTGPTGEPTNAVYGVISTVLKLLREHQVDYLVAVFDPPGKTFRGEIYEEYKANRPPIADDLAAQIPRLHQVLEAMGVAVLTTEGFEADDVIATIVRQARSAGVNVVICSKDKDLEQLLDENVRLFDTKKEKFTDPNTLAKEKGVTPDRVIDMLTLTGDPVDNIPGLPGVGPKTAVKLIEKYGDLDEIIARADELPAKAKAFLSDPANVDKLRLSQKLVTLRHDAPVEFAPDSWRPEIPDRDRLAALFSELGFNRFLQQLDLKPAKAPAAARDGSDKPVFTQIRSLEALSELVGRLADAGRIGVDTETTSTRAMQAELVGISLCCDEDQAYYVPLRTADSQHLDMDKSLAAIKPILENPNVEKIGQNLKYDLIVLRNAGINLAGIAFDTMIASYVLDPTERRHGLDHLAQEVLGYETIKISELIGTGKGQLTLDQVATERVSDYAAEDALVAFRLANVLDVRLKEQGLDELFRDVEMPLLGVLADMECVGVTVDVEALAKLSKQLTGQLDRLTAEIHYHVGHSFNIDSPKQLAEVLFDELGLPAGKKTKTGRSTDVSVLEGLAWTHPVPKLVLEYRQLAKLKNTYIDKLPDMIDPRTERIHTSFNQTVTATGRLSSSDPNLQNIPIRSDVGRQIRAAFVPSDQTNNVLLACDYSQIELRLLAHLSGDENLIDAFRNDRDIHAAVASQIFDVDIGLVSDDQRRVAKTVNFGIIYGQTAHGLARTLGATRTEAQRFIDSYFRRYAGVKRFIEQCIDKAREAGYAATILGRRRQINELTSRAPMQRAFGERLAVNSVVQGSAADLIKVAMINIHQAARRGDLPITLLIQVHDELVCETPRDGVERTARQLGDLMTTAMSLNVPLKVDSTWADNWMESK